MPKCLDNIKFTLERKHERESLSSVFVAIGVRLFDRAGRGLELGGECRIKQH